MHGAKKLVTAPEVLQHNKPDDCWIVVEREVWDVTNFVKDHPGGAPSEFVESIPIVTNIFAAAQLNCQVILKYAGTDATQPFNEVHSLSQIRENVSLECFRGNLDPTSITEEWTAATPKSKAAKKGLITVTTEKPPLSSIINLYDFEQVAATHAPPKAFAFYSTAATDCWTRDSNESMLKRIWFRPRVMRDVSAVDMSSTVLNIPVKFPLFICPTGLARLIHPEAEKALARATKSTGILEIVSSGASHPLEEVVQEAPGYPFMFQLYLNYDKEKSKQTLQEAERLGIKAIFLTVDAAGRGKRESDERLKTEEVVINPVTGEVLKADKKGAGLTRLMGRYIDQGMTWKDIEWIRSVTKLPLILKGITCAADAKIAMQHNVDGIMLSNHGGRNLDFAPTSILLLLEMHKSCPEVFDRMEVYVDGGFRRGGDILKALCLGARAVGIGRSFLYSLQYGEEGAEHLVDLLKEEMESAMKLIGIKNLSEAHPGLVNTSDVDHLVPSTFDHPYAKWRPKSRI